MAFGHKAFTKSRPNRRTNVKIWVEVVAKVECSTKRRLEGRVEGRHAQTTSTSTYTQTTSTTRPILVPSSKKNDFLAKFSIQRFGIVESFPYICRTKDIRQAHSFNIHDIHPHTQSSVFRNDEIFIKQRASSK